MEENRRELDVVRHEVKDILSQSAGFRALGPDERRSFAKNMVKVAQFLAQDPGWLDAESAPEAEALAEAKKDPVEDLKKRLAQKPGQVGKDFEAGAVKQGVEQFGNLVKTVDFPEFVSGLIQGVFQAIVDASIQQMEAYGELLAATAKSVGEFASDHISDDQAREQLASRHPSLVRVERTGEGSRLVRREGVEDTSALQGGRSNDQVDFDDPESERKLITSAKLEMARQRQKMMAMMVMLGINRIVVTNGKINAKVIFDVEASDEAKRKASSRMKDDRSEESGGFATAALPWGAAGGYRHGKHKTTVQSSVDDESESKARMKAQLTGEVQVNFKSETMPPERMLDALQYEQFNYMSQGTAAPATPAQGARPPAPGGERRPA
jgi:hypothetical protein